MAFLVEGYATMTLQASGLAYEQAGRQLDRGGFLFGRQQLEVGAGESLADT